MAFKNALPDQFEKHPDLLFHLTAMLSPRVLQQHNVPVFGALQVCCLHFCDLHYPDHHMGLLYLKPMPSYPLSMSHGSCIGLLPVLIIINQTFPTVC